MANLETSALTYRTDLYTIISNMIWKNQFEAGKYEKYVDSSSADEYVWAAQKLMEGYSTNQIKQIIECTDAKFEALLETAESIYKRPLRIIRLYEEKNDYYRMLNGQPPLHADAFISDSDYGIKLRDLNLSQDVISKLKIQDIYSTGYLHDLTSSQISFIDATGYLTRVKMEFDKDPHYQYLKHMTTHKVYPFVSRMADRFDLLYFPKSKLPSLSDDFAAYYKRSRDYIIQRYYTDAYRNKYEYYEGFVGLAILFMTIQQLNVAYLDTDITREFYDLDSIKVVYQAYSVPFYEDIPIAYHAKIVKLINRLLTYKGSNHIIFDLAALFDFDKLTIYQYYLTKNQYMNQDGTPKFVYNDVYDDNGVFLYKELDYEGTYYVNFVKRAIHQETPFEAVNNINNYLDYKSVILEDHYWLDNAELREKMLHNEYNFIETKYLGLQTQISMTRYFYETIYFMRMLFDNRDVFSTLTIYNTKLGTDMTIFSAVIYLHALICKKLGWVQDFSAHAAPGAKGYQQWTKEAQERYEADPEHFHPKAGDVKPRCSTCYGGEIPSDPTKIAKLMGFNFKQDLELIAYDCLVCDCKHSIAFETNDGDGWYLYPEPKHVETKFETVIAPDGTKTKVINTTWKKLDIHVYTMKNHHTIKHVGCLEDYDTGVDSMRYGIGLGLNANAHDIVDRVLKEVLKHTAVQIGSDYATHRIHIKDASLDMFENAYDKQEFVELLESIDLESSVSVNQTLGIDSTYHGIIKIKEYIENKMLETRDKDVFLAYKHLHKILMTTEILPEIITKSDNTMATSYADLLEDLDYVLAVRLMNLETDDELRDELDYLLAEIQKLATDLIYIPSYGVYNVEVIVEYLYKLIKFFKSVKAQFLDFNIIYVIDSRVDNLVKLMTDFEIKYKQSSLPEDKSLAIATFDVLNRIYELHLVDEEFTTKDVMMQFIMLMHLKSLVFKEDKIALSRLKDIITTFLGIIDHMSGVQMMTYLIDVLEATKSQIDIIDKSAEYRKYTIKELALYMETLYATLQATLEEYAAKIYLRDELKRIIEKEVDDKRLDIHPEVSHAAVSIGPGDPNTARPYGYVLYNGLYDINHDSSDGLAAKVLATERYDAMVFMEDTEEQMLTEDDQDLINYLNEGQPDIIELGDVQDVFQIETDDIRNVGVFATEDDFALYFYDRPFTAPYEDLGLYDDAIKGFMKLYTKLHNTGTLTLEDMFRLLRVTKLSDTMTFTDQLILEKYKPRVPNYGFAIPDPSLGENQVAILTTENEEIISDTVTTFYGDWGNGDIPEIREPEKK